MVAITFRTNGAWGAGIGANLTPAQVDVNFYNLKTSVEDLVDNPVQPVNIADISVTGNQLTITLEDASVFGPFTLPIAEFRDRGEWVALEDYVYGDIFTQTTGLYLVLQDHTAGGVFNPAAANGFGPLYRLLFDASGMTMTFLDAGYPATGVDLHTFEVFSVDDVGVFMVLQEHDALAVFDPDAVGIDLNPLYKKIFAAIETAVARIQFQYPGGFPADESLMWKLIQDDPRNLVLPADFASSIAHLEIAVTSEIVFSFQYDGDEVATLTFSPATLPDGDGGQFGLFEGLGVPDGIANQELLRMFAPGDADTTSRFLTIALVGSYVDP